MRNLILAKSKKTKKFEQSPPPIQVEERVRYSLILTKKFKEDLQWWVNADSKTASKIIELIEDTQQDPFNGLGKPEPLKHEGSGMWSRRINITDRFVYKVDNGKISLLQCRYHYDD